MSKKESKLKKQIKLKNKKLVKEFPFLKPKIFDYNIKEEYDYSYTELDMFPIGWRKAFGLMLMHELKDQLIKENKLHKFYFFDIKEKYGELRIYTENSSEKIDRIIEKYQVLSNNICMNCGKPDIPSLLLGGYVSPYCENCYNKYLKYNKPYEELYIKEKSNKMLDKYSVKQYYTEGTKTIQFNISETSNKIRKNWEKHYKK